MKEDINQLASTLLRLIPEFPMSAEEIVVQIEADGIDAFMKGAGDQTRMLAETMELLSRLEVKVVIE